MMDKEQINIIQRICASHLRADPGVVICVVNSPDIRLIEIIGSISDEDPIAITPIKTNYFPDFDLNIDYSLILLSEKKWQQIKNGELSLPDDWKNYIHYRKLK